MKTTSPREDLEKALRNLVPFGGRIPTNWIRGKRSTLTAGSGGLLGGYLFGMLRRRKNRLRSK